MGNELPILPVVPLRPRGTACRDSVAMVLVILGEGLTAWDWPGASRHAPRQRHAKAANVRCAMQEGQPRRHPGGFRG